MQTGEMSAVRCSVRMLQAAETLNQNPEAGAARGGGGGRGGVMMTMMMMKLLVLLMIM